ncbi:NADH dehydrogenase [ubiquinone] 1 beta subcomplex subunit 6 isoform X2 [Chrysemys picta bellii]|uniref:NADH dehydrogenase [ubiquinone] 1 beta subcomplex subunit 6 isoform X2 n=1 Tax=Chrysemys picta bellii TaxID=8478 RepID=UPI000CE63500|nr:NADH dehydrogenase [ubiquinone] 1 beta subcomplex subunit 6 isoform X2 [Chrysemys picta bellii]
MAGYTPDEKLRLQQLRALRRRWLKDQELSPREPVLPPQKLGPVDRFWKRFLQPGSFWRLQTFKLYRAGVYTVGWLLIPAWIVDYYTKYHIMLTCILVLLTPASLLFTDRIKLTAFLKK